ncbi:hypothetical protein B0H14DRAFT_3127514 [Mycena olivaceomarginata]|nr:hypothetical protein B0H14DRAFT_3127514 [Mycena olivaceomarginata]
MSITLDLSFVGHGGVIIDNHSRKSAEAKGVCNLGIGAVNIRGRRVRRQMRLKTILRTSLLEVQTLRISPRVLFLKQALVGAGVRAQKERAIRGLVAPRQRIFDEGSSTHAGLGKKGGGGERRLGSSRTAHGMFECDRAVSSCLARRIRVILLSRGSESAGKSQAIRVRGLQDNEHGLAWPVKGRGVKGLQVQSEVSNSNQV